MAIIQSILVGKGKGKIGNVVLSNLKGQTVAKQLNSSPSNPRTVAQTDNRVKMANAVLAWQYLSIFFANAKGLRKPLESVYNAFIRTIKSSMHDVLDSSRAIAGAHALAQNLFEGNWFTIGINSFDNEKVSITLSNAGVEWLSSYRVRTLLIDSVTENQLITEIALTEAAFESGTVLVPHSGMNAPTIAAAYIYDSASSKITNIKEVHS